MAQRVVERTAHHDEGKEYVEVIVLFHARTVKVRVKKGSTKKEIWEAIKKAAAKEGIIIGNLSELTITIESKVVVIDDTTGTIKEVDEETGDEQEVQDEVVYNDIVVGITGNVEGGKLF